tara:strand:- start:319 stop:519 length:201 start_codon:yes stop_codon:yes gene_type:complete
MIEITYAIAISFVGMFAAYYMGRYSNQKDMEQIAGNLIEILEKDGYVKTILDENGDKALVKIDEIS